MRYFIFCIVSTASVAALSASSAGAGGPGCATSETHVWVHLSRGPRQITTCEPQVKFFTKDERAFFQVGTLLYPGNMAEEEGGWYAFTPTEEHGYCLFWKNDDGLLTIILGRLWGVRPPGIHFFTSHLINQDIRHILTNKKGPQLRGPFLAIIETFGLYQNSSRHK